MASSQVESFEISVPEVKLQRLRRKLELTDFPNQLESDTKQPWDRGPPNVEIKRLLDYWRDKYDWRKAEVLLNTSLPQFTTSIEVSGFGTYKIHFVHLRSRLENAIPLLFLHGWPGSFYEVSKIAHPLTEGNYGNEPAFHVVAPSLIDHGFSSGSRFANFHVDQHAEAYNKLMLVLGYGKYVAQGGDTGYVISRMLAQMFPQNCRAHHINMAVPFEPSPTKHPKTFAKWHAQGGFDGLSPLENSQLERANHFRKEGSGYFAIHTTRPLALGYSMTDSPVGLLAWIYDKLVTWTDNYPWTEDEVLTWVSIYYFSEAGPASSFNTYYSNFHRKPRAAFNQVLEYTDNPLGVSRFAKEILNMPKVWNHTLGPIVFEAEHGKGGHFAAFEVPDLLVKDLRMMFGHEGVAFRIIDDADGYMREKSHI